MATQAENDKDGNPSGGPAKDKADTVDPASAAPGKIRCPACGGLATRKWGSVTLLDFVVFILAVVLAPIVLRALRPIDATVGQILTLGWIGLILGAFWALPVFGAVTVMARARCRRCGHRFWPRWDASSPIDTTRFPVRFAVIGSAILLVILLLGLFWIWNVPGRETWTVGLTFLAGVIAAGLILGFGLLVQAIVWKSRQERKPQTAQRGLTLLVPTFVFGAAWLGFAVTSHHVFSKKFAPVVRAPGVLDRAGLADLPSSAHGVKVYSFGFICSGKYILRFAADPNDIETFLAASPSLEDVACRAYSDKQMRLPARDLDDVYGLRPHDGNDYFDPNDVMPSWYIREIRGPGRRYDIKWYDGMYQGELLIDDEDHVVYVHVDRF